MLQAFYKGWLCESMNGSWSPDPGITGERNSECVGGPHFCQLPACGYTPSVFPSDGSRLGAGSKGGSKESGMFNGSIFQSMGAMPWAGPWWGEGW